MRAGRQGKLLNRTARGGITDVPPCIDPFKPRVTPYVGGGTPRCPYILGFTGAPGVDLSDADAYRLPAAAVADCRGAVRPDGWDTQSGRLHRGRQLGNEAGKRLFGEAIQPSASVRAPRLFRSEGPPDVGGLPLSDGDRVIPAEFQGRPGVSDQPVPVHLGTEGGGAHRSGGEQGRHRSGSRGDRGV